MSLQSSFSEKDQKKYYSYTIYNYRFMPGEDIRVSNWKILKLPVGEFQG